MEKKAGIKWYSVYNQKGEHQASYDQFFADAKSWAIDCARHVAGYVCECGIQREETVVYNALDKRK